MPATRDGKTWRSQFYYEDWQGVRHKKNKRGFKTKAEADVIAAKKKYDQATANLKELLDKRDAIRKEEILSAVVKSGRSYEEIMNFLNAGLDGEKTEK